MAWAIDGIRRSNEVPIDVTVLLEDAKVDGILLNRTRLEEQPGGRYMLWTDAMQLLYWYCGFKSIHGSTNAYEFADISCRKDLMTVLPAVLESIWKTAEEPATRESQAREFDQPNFHRSAAAKEAEAALVAQV